MRGTPGTSDSQFNKIQLETCFPAELKGPGNCLRIRPKMIDLGPKSAPKSDEAKPNMPGAVPTNKHKPIPIDFGPVSGCFDHDPKLFNCEILNVTQQCFRAVNRPSGPDFGRIATGKAPKLALRPAFGRPEGRIGVSPR